MKNNSQQIWNHPAPIVSVNSRILLVDDDEDLRKLIDHKFKMTQIVIDQADGVRRAKELLYENNYELIVLDLMMKPDSGYLLFDHVKNDPKWKWTPLIVLSGSDEIKDKVQCLNMGADDYVTKPFDFEELYARVQRILVRSKQFEQMAFFDTLTGIYNRRYFENQLQIELERSKRYSMPISMALVDIDHFKGINDTYGHQMGDRVLQGLSYVMKQNLRSSDLLARYGGEEFVVMLPNTTVDQAETVMNAILEKVRVVSFAKVDTEDIHITFSSGIASLEQELTAQEWIKRADHRLYEAKQMGRNRVLSWS